MFKVTKYFTLFSSVSIVEFEHAFVCWDGSQRMNGSSPSGQIPVQNQQ